MRVFSDLGLYLDKNFCMKNVMLAACWLSIEKLAQIHMFFRKIFISLESIDVGYFIVVLDAKKISATNFHIGRCDNVL